MATPIRNYFSVPPPTPFLGVCEILEIHEKNAHIGILKNPEFRNRYIWAATSMLNLTAKLS